MFQSRLHRKLYGQSLIDGLLSAARSSTARLVPNADGQKLTNSTDVVLETPEALALQRSQVELRQKLGGASNNAAASASASISSANSNGKAIAKPIKVSSILFQQSLFF